MNTLYPFALVNAVLCVAVAAISLCRLKNMQGCVLRRVRSEYSVYVAAAVASALQPWFGEWPQWASLGMAGAMLFGLLCSNHAWRGGAVPDVATDLGELRNMDGSAI